MIKIESKKNKFTYNVYHVTKAFYPKEDIVQTVDEKQEPLVKIHLPEGTCFSLAPEECVQTEDVQEEKRDHRKFIFACVNRHWKGFEEIIDSHDVVKMSMCQKQCFHF